MFDESFSYCPYHRIGTYGGITNVDLGLSVQAMKQRFRDDDFLLETPDGTLHQ